MQVNVFPKNYEITLEPDFNSFTFKGKEIITLQFQKKLPKISLDAVNLNVKSCTLLDGKKTSLEHKVVNGKLEIACGSSVKIGENKIEIAYEGELNDKLAGFYRSDYIEDGKKKYMATSQFEAADARQAFPCYDEPSYKATFDITLIVDKDLKTISNMPRKNVKMLDDGKKSVTFERTPIMSTYLVYLGVGEFEIKHGAYKNVDIRGITTKGKSQYTDFAIDVAKKSLEYFEEYFGVQYPLPKLDLIAIPDFASGAMENWGAITFRENALLYYPDKSSLSTKQRIAEVVAHELAHQWFGNLVTMKWWDDLWLNESFATFMAYKVLDRFWPEWDTWTEYIMMTVFEGMYLDSLKSSHSIKVKVNSIEEMNELFDEIAYDKGGSVLRMIERFMGEENFKKGLQMYIKQFKYTNTEAKDLWLSLEKSGKKSIVNLVEKYITQVGFPQVTVTHTNNQLDFSQTRFLFKQNDTKTGWNIPLLLKYEDSKNEELLMQKESVKYKAMKGPVTINADYGAFFISQYSEKMLTYIGRTINSLNNKEKIGLLHDLYYLSKFQKQPFSIFLQFINDYFKDEKEPAVLYYLVQILDSVNSLVKRADVKEVLSYFAQRGLDLIGLEPKSKESTYNTFLRSSALSSLSELDDQKVATFLNKKFLTYLKNPKEVHPDLRLVTFKNAVWSDSTNYEKVLDLYRKSTTQEEQIKLLHALLNSRNAKQIKDGLDFCLGPEVRFANTAVGISAASSNPFGKDIVLKWLFKNWGEFGKRVGGHGGVLLRRFVKIVIPTCGIGYDDEVKEFILKNRIAGLEKTFEQVWEELEIFSRFVQSLK